MTGTAADLSGHGEPGRPARRRGRLVPQQVTRWPAPRCRAPVDAVVRVPGSKSMTARALILAALSVGPSTLRHPPDGPDTRVMARGLRSMGTHVSTVDDDLWLVRPRPLRGPAHIDAESTGTVARLLPSVAALADGPVSIAGAGRGGDRGGGAGLAPLTRALRKLGVPVLGDDLPLTVQGIGRVPGGEVRLDASASSQFVSGLLMAGTDYDHGVVVRHDGPPLPVAPHLRLTVTMLRAVGAAVDDGVPNVWEVEPGRLRGRGWRIEPDLVSAGPFLAAALVTGGRVLLRDWPQRTAQAGDELIALLSLLGARCVPGTDGLTVTGTGTVRAVDADLSALGELVPVVAALCAVADGPSTLRGVAGSRCGDPDRLSALRTALGTLGADITEEPDRLTIRPRPLSGALVDTGADHRIAYAAAVLGLVVDGVVLSDVACTAKTLPGFPAMWFELLGERR